ncbi:catechol O-methyltransferase-like [Asterias amurensis]|uniref:catechol O-methyltransferase-like n=1 Tax=Asterias amurensis TaxID=7602 RepID=UPI003AB90EDF
MATIGSGLEACDMTEKAEKMVSYVLDHAKKGDPASLLASADKYCYTVQRLMNVGEIKGAIVTNILKDLAPKTCLELGTYCGYSAVLMASILPNGSRLLTVEADEGNAEIAKKFIDHAGIKVKEKITVIVNNSDEVIPKLREDFSVDFLDFVFIDHWKNVYLRDLQLLETHGLLRKGTVIVADNVIYPGAPEYLEYVTTSEKYQTETFDSTLEYSDKKDAVAKSVYLVE